MPSFEALPTDPILRTALQRKLDQYTAAEYLGPVANRTFWPSALLASRYAVTQTRHVLADKVAKIQLTFAGVYQINGVETATGFNRTIRASISEDANFTNPIQVTFSGSASGTCLQTALLSSDFVDMPASLQRPGAVLYVRTWQDAGAGGSLPYNYLQNNSIDSARGEVTKTSYSSALTDYTMVAGPIPAVGTNLTQNWMGPVMIRGYTRKPTFILYGDSRLFGMACLPSESGGLGPYQLALDSLGLAYIVAAVSGDRASWFSANSRPQQISLASSASHAIWSYGGNDLSNGDPPETLYANMLLGLAKLPESLVVLPATLGLSNVSSSDAYTSLKGQYFTTSNSYRNTMRKTYNTSLRSFSRSIDYAPLIEQETWWRLGPSPSTEDGSHESIAISSTIAPDLAILIANRI